MNSTNSQQMIDIIDRGMFEEYQQSISSPKQDNKLKKQFQNIMESIYKVDTTSQSNKYMQSQPNPVSFTQANKRVL